MTQKELREKLDDLNYSPHEFILNTEEINVIMDIINQHTKEVIGEDENGNTLVCTFGDIHKHSEKRLNLSWESIQNRLRKQQRKKAGL